MVLVQKAAEDIEQAGQAAGVALRAALDAAVERIGTVAGDFRKRAEDGTSEFTIPKTARR